MTRVVITGNKARREARVREGEGTVSEAVQVNGCETEMIATGMEAIANGAGGC